MVYISANFMKIMPTERHSTKEFYTDFHVNSTSGLADDNRLQAKQTRANK